MSVKLKCTLVYVQSTRQINFAVRLNVIDVVLVMSCMMIGRGRGAPLPSTPAPGGLAMGAFSDGLRPEKAFSDP